MKRRILVFLLTFLIVLGQLALPVFAWEPDYCFYCYIEPAQMPEGTVYIDLLMPVSPENDGYVAYHEGNGELYGISADSEIVAYCEDGYRSYTFHIEDATSELVPTMGWSENYWYTRYNKERDATYDYEYCCSQYKFAKMAYLNAEGDVLGVSSRALIRAGRRGDVRLNLVLSGLDFTSDPQSGPPMYLLVVIPALLLPVLLTVPALIAYTVVTDIDRRRERKRQGLR